MALRDSIHMRQKPFFVKDGTARTVEQEQR